MLELNPALHKRMSIMCETLRCDEDFIKSEAYRFLDENRLDGGGADAKKLLSLHKAVRTRVLAAMFDSISGESLEEKHFADIEKLLENGRDGARIMLPGKIAAAMKS